MSNRFEIFGEDGKWLVKDNEQMPHLLDLYKCHIRMNEFIDKIKELETQLAEKEKENIKLKEVVDCVDKLKQFNADMSDYALVNRDVADEIYCEHQDKISFAVEQLEKVKETTEIVLDKALKNSSLNQSYYDRLLDEIDNQIKEIKGKEVV